LPDLHKDVTATTVVLGALASRDNRGMHHDREFAQVRNGTRDIFMNTPNQAAWFERYLNDWTGPKGRLGKIVFRMLDSVYPSETMVFSGTVTEAWVDDTGCCWVKVAVELTVDGNEKTRAVASVALPNGDDDNPWSRRGDRWKP
jgi:hypothetical protein